MSRVCTTTACSMVSRFSHALSSYMGLRYETEKRRLGRRFSALLKELSVEYRERQRQVSQPGTVAEAVIVGNDVAVLHGHFAGKPLIA